MPVADRPQAGLLAGLGETGAELHRTAAVTHRDFGMLHDVVIPEGVTRCACKRRDQKHAVIVRDVHKREREDAAAPCARHRDEADFAASEAVKKASARQAVQKHVKAGKDFDAPVGMRSTCWGSGFSRHAWPPGKRQLIILEYLYFKVAQESLQLFLGH